MNFIDINGDSLGIPSTPAKGADKSLDDLSSIINTNGVGLIATDLDKTGTANVTIVWGDMSDEDKKKALASDPGLALLNKLISAVNSERKPENYYYVASTSMEAIEHSTGNTVNMVDQTNPKVDGTYASITNASITPRNIDRGLGPADIKPSNGYSGAVRISPDGNFEQHYTDGTTSPIRRASVVFHELYENYDRTHNKQPYERANGSGAHSNAAKAEGNTYGNKHPGNAHFKRY